MSNNIALKALDGANPLCMLAALGAFRIAVLNDDEATIHWENDAGWRPVIRTRRTEQQFVDDVVAELHRLAGSDAKMKRAAELQKELVKLQKEADKKGKKAPPPAQLEEMKQEIVRLQALLTVLQKPAAAPGVPLIDGHDLVAVRQDEFRLPASAPLKGNRPPCLPTDADFYAALGCDTILKEKNGVGLAIEPTPFSFSNGGSGKCLLKDFRNCSANASHPAVQGLMTGPMVREDEVTSLLWDPADQKSYALRWSDPANRSASPPRANATANALAFLGLTFLPVIPSGTRIIAIGMDKRLRKWTWPIWEVPISSRIVTALLASSALQQSNGTTKEQLKRSGIATAYSVRRFYLNKRPFFSPSKAI